MQAAFKIDVSDFETRLNRLGTEVFVGVKAAVKRNGENVYKIARELTPRRTGFSRENLILTEGGPSGFAPLGFGWTLGFYAQDYHAAGKEFYAPYFIFGTRRTTAGGKIVATPSQDPLTPAMAGATGDLQDQLVTALNRAFRDAET